MIWKRIKEFLRPTWPKIGLTLVICLIAVLSIVLDFYSHPRGCGSVDFPLPCLLGNTVLIFLVVPSFLFGGIPMVSSLLYWYVLSCSLDSIYDTIKKSGRQKANLCMALLVAFISGLFLMTYEERCFQTFGTEMSALLLLLILVENVSC